MTKEFTYIPSPEVCSEEIRVVVKDEIVEKVEFVGGCHGNTQGVAALAQGMHREEVIRRLEGICCKKKGTSCPDQLARALKEMV